MSDAPWSFSNTQIHIYLNSIIVQVIIKNILIRDDTVIMLESSIAHASYCSYLWSVDVDISKLWHQEAMEAFYMSCQCHADPMVRPYSQCWSYCIHPAFTYLWSHVRHRLGLFGHVARLDNGNPAPVTLDCTIASTLHRNGPPEDWKRPPGGASCAWVQPRR